MIASTQTNHPLAGGKSGNKSPAPVEFATGKLKSAGLRITQIDIDVEDEVRDLLHHAGDVEIGTEFSRQFDITAAACLQIALMRRSIDRRDVEDRKLSGFRDCLAQLIAGAHQPPFFVGPRPIHFALKAGIHQFEIKHGDFGWIGARRS